MIGEMVGGEEEGRRRVRMRGAIVAVSVSVFSAGGSRCCKSDV